MTNNSPWGAMGGLLGSAIMVGVGFSVLNQVERMYSKPYKVGSRRRMF
jgi:hypothetical protein